MPYPYASDREEVLSRLRKVEGQVRGVQRMVSEEAPCVDILTQVSAVISGMEKVGLRLLQEHVRGSLAEAAKASKKTGTADDHIDEIVKTIERFLQA